MVSGDFFKMHGKTQLRQTPNSSNPVTQHGVSRKCLKRATAWLKPYAEQYPGHGGDEDGLRMSKV